MSKAAALAALLWVAIQDSKDSSGADIDGPYLFEAGGVAEIEKEMGFALGGRLLAIEVPHARGPSQAALRVNGSWFRLKSDGTKEKLEGAK